MTENPLSKGRGAPLAPQNKNALEEQPPSAGGALQETTTFTTLRKLEKDPLRDRKTKE